ncbi:hypothetical protein B0H14DRAFT_2634672 [Mycena olivaceomarginata]|nr:hypothetical protein B0H14DRAFT_2634672 [Mycena olivaceomarginata]
MPPTFLYPLLLLSMVENSILKEISNISQLSGMLFAKFNQDYSCVSVDTRKGYSITNCDPFGRVYTQNTGPGSSPRKLQIVNTKRQSMICELLFILAVKLNRKTLVIVLKMEIYMYDISNMRLLHVIQTAEAICALSPSVDAPYLAYPAPLPSPSLAAASTSSNSTSSGAASATSTSSSNSSTNLDAGTGCGDVMLFSTPALAPANIVPAHRSPIAVMALSANGGLLTIASGKGTVIPVFATPSLDKLYQFRHGTRETRIYSLAFNGAGTLLAAGSERGTVHLWRVGKSPGDKDKGGSSSAPLSSSNGNGNGNAHSPAESTDGHTDAGYETFVTGQNEGEGGRLAGPFHMYSIPRDHIADDGNSSQPPMYAFCLPGHESLLTTSTACLRSAMSFYTIEFGSYPFGSYKLAFVDEMPTQRFDSSTFLLLTVDLLHAEDAIEQSLEMRHALSHALACQWMGINIQPKFFSDTWLVNGLVLYITGLFIKKLLGNNEYRFRLKKDTQHVVEREAGGGGGGGGGGGCPPFASRRDWSPRTRRRLRISISKHPSFCTSSTASSGGAGPHSGSHAAENIPIRPDRGEQYHLDAHVSGVNSRTFVEQWIYSSGCPTFGFSASFNRKKMAVEITMRQECPAYKMVEGNEHALALLKPVRIFEGQMTVRIHEADGTPYEHVLDIQAPFKRYEVPFNMKYKRVRRNTKRYLARQAAAQAAAEGDTEAAEAMGMVDMGFGLEVWEKESERNNWKVEDWTEEDEPAVSGATYEWIRMDADFEWIADLKFEQQDFMWVSALQRDRDVVAQLEALHALAQQPTKIVSSTLTKTVLVSNYYFRIRCEAAVALVHCSILRLDYLGLFHLFKLFLRYCYDPEDPNQDLFAHTYVPKPNDFSDLSEYFVRKALISAISRTRYPNGKSPSIVRKFLIDQLRYNDNTSNAVIRGRLLYLHYNFFGGVRYDILHPRNAASSCPQKLRTEYNEDTDLLKQSLSEVDRYRAMDRFIPSTHNNVTIACLEVAVLHVEFALESGIMARVVNGAAGEAVVGVDVLYDNEIKAVKVHKSIKVPWLVSKVTIIVWIVSNTQSVEDAADVIWGGFATIHGSENMNLNVEINAIFLPLIAYICTVRQQELWLKGRWQMLGKKINTV